MRRTAYRPYVLLALFFIGVMSFPKTASEKLRSALICSFSPAWRGLNVLKLGSLRLLTITPPGSQPSRASASVEIERLKQENQIFRTQIENVRQWLLYEDRIQEQLERFKDVLKLQDQDVRWKEFFHRRAEVLCQSLELQLQSLPAKVIYRDPASWSSIVWLNVGEKENKALGKQVVAKNSPVLVGTSIVGVVEYVGKHQCRVRLISDSRLAPAVRAVRGKEQNRYLVEYIDALLFGLELRDDLFQSADENSRFIQGLDQLKHQLMQQPFEMHLAKGELCGASRTFFRTRGAVLKGMGFNCDFADRESPARDLRSGEPFSEHNSGQGIAILKEGDLLVTSGLDGIFPPGFRVATVSQVSRLKEGGSSYEIEARPTAGNLEELSEVFVLPPLDFEPLPVIDLLHN